MTIVCARRDEIFECPVWPRIIQSIPSRDYFDLLLRLSRIYSFQQEKRHGQPPSELDLKSVMCNEMPGSGNNLTCMSFEGGFHGRSLGILSATRSRPAPKLDMPAFDWPVAKFPRYKYPLEANEAHNREEDRKCLQTVCFICDVFVYKTNFQVEDSHKEYTAKGKTVVCLIVEPFQANIRVDLIWGREGGGARGD